MIIEDKSYQMLSQQLKTKKTERDKVDRNCKFDYFE
jgi:hypothetical protein